MRRHSNASPLDNTDQLLASIDPGFFPHVCDCSSRREIAREIALEEQDRLRAEGLLSEFESDEEELGPLEEGKSDEAAGDVQLVDNEANDNIVAEG